jgi:hypothetical protein
VTDELFNDDQDPMIDENKDYLAELVGDGKKFRDEQALARGKMESDQYISTLQKKLDELTADYQRLDTDYKARASLEELLKKATQNDSSNDNTQVKQIEQPNLKPEDIQNLVSQEIRANEQQKRQNENVRRVADKLKEHFGERYQGPFKQRVESLGLSEDFVRDLARNYPEVLFKTLELDHTSTDTFQAPPRSSQRNDSFAPRGAQKRTWSYYQEMKKKDPKAYYSRENTVQMHKDAVELGSEFGRIDA